MNQMAKDLDQTMEYLANTTFETLKDVCDVQADINTTQAGQVTCLQDEVQTGVDVLIAAGGGGEPQRDFMIYNTNHWSVTNGGCCLNWTVPTGVKVIKFEILSGGGPGGSSGDDYDTGLGGAGGNYTSKLLCLDAGEFNSVAGSESSYTLCAAGTSQCSCCLNCNRNCRHGCKSYATGPGLSNFCSMGGHGGSTSWDVNSNCYSCHIGNIQCDRGNYNAGWVTHQCNNATYGGDVEFRGTTGSYHRQYNCCSDSFSTSGGAVGPFSSGTGGIGKHWCVGNSSCCSGHSAFPAGGGQGHQSGSGSDCWGGFGAGGLVKVTYQ
jgi:hypothetical protein